MKVKPCAGPCHNVLNRPPLRGIQGWCQQGLFSFPTATSIPSHGIGRNSKKTKRLAVICIIASDAATAPRPPSKAPPFVPALPRRLQSGSGNGRRLDTRDSTWWATPSISRRRRRNRCAGGSLRRGLRSAGGASCIPKTWMPNWPSSWSEPVASRSATALKAAAVPFRGSWPNAFRRKGKGDKGDEAGKEWPRASGRSIAAARRTMDGVR